jgi:hypothetical protein
MEPLDGNAIAGDLFDYFGAEMTTTRGSCAHCGSSGLIGELHVYAQAPGKVARCRVCGKVVMVLVSIRDSLQVDASDFRLHEAPATGPITER